MSDNNININTPDIGPYTQLRPFRFWCQKVLPLVYDESLSYYELLCKVVDYLNKTMEDVDQMITDMGDFKTADTEFKTEVRDAYIAFSREVSQAVEGLETFVNNYFNNLNVQTEINNKLDAMAASGYFNSLFSTLFTTDIINEAGNVTSAWIAANLLQETGYVIDKSLSVENAAADAKATGDAIKDINAILYPVTNDLVTKLNKNRYNGLKYPGYLSNIGALVVSSDWYSTGPIYVGDLAEIAASCYIIATSQRDPLPLHFCCTYDENGDFIEQIWTNGQPTLEIDEGVSFIRFSFHDDPINSVQVESGDTPTAYSPYDYGSLVEKVNENTTAIATKVQSAEKVEYNGVTLSDIIDANFTENYVTQTLTFEEKTGFYSVAGVFYTYSDIYGASLEVEENDTFLLSGYTYYDVASAVFLDADDQFISGVRFEGDTVLFQNEEIVAPKNAASLLLQKKTEAAYMEIKKLVNYKGMTKSNLAGKNITLIGDSITEYNWRAAKNWAMYMNEWTGAVIQNLGVSGTGFVKSSPYVNRISSIQADPDIIGVAVSFNDLTAGLPVGSSSDTGTSSICGYVNDFFDALITAYPATPVICYVQNVWNGAHPGLATPDSLIAAIKEICANKGVPFYDDLYKGSVLRPWIHENRVVYFTSDNPEYPAQMGEEDTSHPNSVGHKVIARILYPKFSENLVTEGLDYV